MMKKKNTVSRLNKTDYIIFISCIILAGFMLFLFYKDINDFSIKQNESPVAKISFKENQVQRKIIDRNIWEKITLATSIYDGDTIRTASGSKVTAEFSDGNTDIQLSENSMIQIFQNKKKDSISFLDGEINLKNKTGSKSVKVQTGIKEISVFENSEVVMSVQKNSTDLNSQEAVINVISGEIDISNIPEIDKLKNDNNHQSVKAGETASFKIVDFTQDIVKAIKETSKEKENKDTVFEQEIKIISCIKEGEQGSKKIANAAFSYLMYDYAKKLYNYQTYIKISELLSSDKMIPKGSAIEVTLSGIPDTSLDSLAFQISTGEEKWIEAEVFRWEGFSDINSLKKGEFFEIKRILVVNYDIVNTSNSDLVISYMPEILDKEIRVSDYKISAKVLTLDSASNITPIKSGYSKTIKIGETKLYKESSYGLVNINTEKLFGDLVSIKKGTKLKFSISAVPSDNIVWCETKLFYNSMDENYVNSFLSNDNEKPVNLISKETRKNVEFEYSQIYTIKRDVELTNNSIFQILFVGFGKIPGSLKNVTLTVQILE